VEDEEAAAQLVVAAVVSNSRRSSSMVADGFESAQRPVSLPDTYRICIHVLGVLFIH